MLSASRKVECAQSTQQTKPVLRWTVTWRRIVVDGPSFINALMVCRILQRLRRLQEQVWWRRRRVLAWKRKGFINRPRSRVSWGWKLTPLLMETNMLNIMILPSQTKPLTTHCLVILVMQKTSSPPIIVLLFSRKDWDNDIHDGSHCTASHRGAWLCNNCYMTFIYS